MLHIALFEPEIPPNTGNIMRLCANTGFCLHLIEPLGFSLDDKKMRRAGLDYYHEIELKIYKNFNEFNTNTKDKRVFALTTKATSCYTEFKYQDNDLFLLGPETRGLPTEILELYKQNCIRLPMLKTSRSLNLSNTAAIIMYEALRQMNFSSLE